MYLSVYPSIYLSISLSLIITRHLAQALACHFSASRCFAAAPSCILLAIAMDYLIVLIAATNSLLIQYIGSNFRATILRRLAA
jgi:hypothetical protein